MWWCTICNGTLSNFQKKSWKSNKSSCLAAATMKWRGKVNRCSFPEHFVKHFLSFFASSFPQKTEKLLKHFKTLCVNRNKFSLHFFWSQNIGCLTAYLYSISVFWQSCGKMWLLCTKKNFHTYFLRFKKVGTLDWAHLFPADAYSTSSEGNSWATESS